MRACYLTAPSTRYEQPIGLLAQKRDMSSEHHVERSSVREGVTGQVAPLGVKPKDRQPAITFSTPRTESCEYRAALFVAILLKTRPLAVASGVNWTEAPALSPVQELQMPPRGKPVSSRRPSRAAAVPIAHKRSSGPADAATRRWRRHARPTKVRAAISATKSLRWNRRLIEAVLDELYVDDHFEELLGRARGDLRPGQYAQAVAVALLLRHSWHPDDLACMLKRLKLRVGN